MAGQGLDFVKNDDGASDVVDAAQVGGAIGKETFEEANGGGDDNGRVPVFGCTTLGGIFIEVFIIAGADVPGVVFEYGAGTEDIDENLGVLLNDGEVRNDDDHATDETWEGKRACESEGHGRECLGSAGWDGQREDIAVAGGGGTTRFEHSHSGAFDRSGGHLRGTLADEGEQVLKVRGGRE